MGGLSFFIIFLHSNLVIYFENYVLCSSLRDNKSFCLFQNIDVDQIVNDHYEAISTPQSSAEKIHPVMSSCNDKSTLRNMASLPPELCSFCSHGCKVFPQLEFLSGRFSTFIYQFTFPASYYSIYVGRPMPRSLSSSAGNEG